MGDFLTRFDIKWPDLVVLCLKVDFLKKPGALLKQYSMASSYILCAP